MRSTGTIEKQDEIYWYMPRKVGMSIINATNRYINNEPYELPQLMSDKNMKTLQYSYNMDPENVIDWFMDGTDHDMKYVDMLLTMADAYNWSEPEI